MSDLISRKKIRDYIKGEINPYGKPFEGTAYELGLKIIRYIDSMDSAYDIDNVIEELEERADFLKDCTKYGNKNAKQQAESYNTMMMYEVADLVDDLIEIVKQDSVDDVCEWKVFDNSLTDEPQWVYETTCGKYVGEEHTSKAFVYCPYCGKKIKIVGD